MPLHHLVDSGQPISPPPDIQRTTLSLDALGRYVCSTWDEATGDGTRRFDAVVIGGGMFGGYCAEKIYRLGEAAGLKVLVLDAGAFLLPTHLQNLPQIGFNVPRPLAPSDDPGSAREMVWGMPWRGNTEFVGPAYCLGGKSLWEWKKPGLRRPTMRRSSPLGQRAASWSGRSGSKRKPAGAR